MLISISKPSFKFRVNTQYRRPFGVVLFSSIVLFCMMGCEDEIDTLPDDMITKAITQMDTEQFFDRLIKLCDGGARLEIPNLGLKAPPVRLLYARQPCEGIPAKGVGIFVKDQKRWIPVYMGHYDRGSNAADRGGRVYRYRLVNDVDSNVFLIFKEGRLMIEAPTRDPLILWVSSD